MKSPTEALTVLRGGDSGQMTYMRDGIEGDIDITFTLEDDYLEKPYVLADGANCRSPVH